MKARLLQFIDRLRHAGLTISPAETLDASRALGVVGVDRAEMREALAAAVIKNQADRAVFEDEFDRFFALPIRRSAKREQPQASGGGARARPAAETPEGLRGATSAEPKRRETPRGRERRGETQRQAERQRSHDRRTLADLSFDRMTPDQIEGCDLLLRHFAQLLHGRQRRRLRRAQRGRIDLRRTLRRSIGSGGVPVVAEFRRRRPGKPDLVALCDLSHSVAQASRFLLSLLGAAPALFRRVRLFGYVDRPVEIWLQDGHLVHDQDLDLYARSDFGNVMTELLKTRDALLTRNTLLLILGDARNNRRPPRADLLARMEQAVQRVVWLNPEPKERWNTGDSVLGTYESYCTDLVGVRTPRELYLALKSVTR